MINNLIGEYTCDRCGRFRNTIFIKKGNGNIECLDCNKDIPVETNKLIEIQKDDKRFRNILIEVYYEYLLEDMELFYKILYGSENYLGMFLDGDTLKRDVLMYYNNDYQFVEYMRTIAISFRDTITDNIFDGMSLKWVKRYLELRERKISEEEMEVWYLESDIEIKQLEIVI